MAFKIVGEEGATDLDPDELTGLIPTHLIHQFELNQWEQMNISKAEQWLTSKKHKNV